MNVLTDKVTFLLDGTESFAKSSSPVDVLTKKEVTVLNYIAQGFSNKVIAEKISISQHTVVSHMKAIYVCDHLKWLATFFNRQARLF